MNKQADLLLVHNDTNNNKTTAVIVEEKNIVQKTKEFLKNIAKNNKPNAIILSAEGKDKNFTVAYEKENFIIVSKNGLKKSAMLYGNWDEALTFVSRILTKEVSPQKKSRIMLAEYTL